MFNSVIYTRAIIKLKTNLLAKINFTGPYLQGITFPIFFLFGNEIKLFVDIFNWH